MVSLKTACKEGLEQATKHVDGLKHGFRQFDHQLRSTVQGGDNHFKQVLNQVDEFGQSVLTKVDDFGKQLDILINHQLIVLAEDFKPIAQQIDKGLTKVRDFIYPYRESVLVPVGGPNIDSGPVAYTHNSLDDFISSRQAYVERIEQTRKFSLNGGGEALEEVPPRKVSVSIEPIYIGDSLRPDSFEIFYQIEGELPEIRTIVNKSKG